MDTLEIIMFNHNTYFQLYSYIDFNALPKIIPINVHCGTIEDFWRTSVRTELNNDRKKYFLLHINIIGYHINIKIPYKTVGRYHYGKYMKDNK
jgi:hypothetical protein